MITSERLHIRKANITDDHFIFGLLNSATWIFYIGDRGIKTISDAQAYINDSLIGSYNRLGHGLYVVTMAESNEAIGLCGLLQRDYLEDPDLGFAILPNYEGQGYTKEASLAVLAYEQKALGLSKVAAITSEENLRSRQLLLKLGFKLNPDIQKDDKGQSFLHYILAL